MQAGMLLAGADEALDAEATSRLEGLQDKLRELQEQGTAAAEASQAAAVAPAAHEDEGEEQQEIDSGSDTDEEAAAHPQLEDQDDAEQSRRASHAEAGACLLSAGPHIKQARSHVGGIRKVKTLCSIRASRAPRQCSYRDSWSWIPRCAGSSGRLRIRAGQSPGG